MWNDRTNTASYKTPGKGGFFLSLLLICNISSYCCAGAEENSKPIIIEYFYEAGCNDCDKIKYVVLPLLEERYFGYYDLRKFDIAEKNNFIKLAEYHERFKIMDNEPVSMFVNGRYALNGFKRIDAGLFAAIDKALMEPVPIQVGKPLQRTEEEVLGKRIQKFTVYGIIINGIIDGLNPCAFSTIVFFMSLLTVAGISNFKLIQIGISFTIATFVTYTAIGFGVFQFLYALAAFPYVKIAFNMVLTAFLIILALLSFRDAWKFNESRDQRDVTVKLPDSIRDMIHKIMKNNVHSTCFLIGGAGFVGVVVTALESVCTGQVYVPTLVALIKLKKDIYTAFPFLLLYNLMFVLPMIIVFVCSYYGIKTPALIRWSRKNVVFSKVLLGIFFIGMAVLFYFL